MRLTARVRPGREFHCVDSLHSLLGPAGIEGAEEDADPPRFHAVRADADPSPLLLVLQ